MALFKKSGRDRSQSPDTDYAKLGKILTRVLVRDNLLIEQNWRRFIGISFLRGLFVGLGTVVGATILVAITLWLLNIFGGLPIVGEWFNTVREPLQEGSPL